MVSRFCSSCGHPSPPSADARRRCLACGAEEERFAQPRVATLVLRGAEANREVLLVSRLTTATWAPGLWELPGGSVREQESLVEAARRNSREKTGLNLELGAVADCGSFKVNDGTVLSTILCAKASSDREARPGPKVESVAWFELKRLPQLASDFERRVLSELSGKKLDNGEARALRQIEDLEVNLASHARRYDELMDLYMQELVRGAWINDLLVKVANENDVHEITKLTVRHVMTQSDLALTRIWLPGPPDLCASCSWAPTCAQIACLHLSVSQGNEDFVSGAQQNRVPPQVGTPVGDTALRNDLTLLELPRKAELPAHFEGFPLDVGLDTPGVLGIYAEEAREPGERRSFQFVARAIGAAIKNARLHQELKRSDQVKRIFIDKMSNELKTPLTVILGYAELLKEELEAAGNDYGAECAGAVEKSGRDLYGLVESILFMTKLESGSIAPKLRRFDGEKVLREVVAEFQPQCRERNLELLCETENVQILSDESWFKRIVTELIANAVKFTKEGRINVRMGATDSELAFSILDTGMGLAKTNRMRIFEPFTQGTQVEDDYQVNLRFGGLGVGLAIARALVNHLGGRLWVESALGEGSEFSFTIPLSAQ